MAFSNARYLTSALSDKQWPNSELPEVLLVGRSNFGKSSLLNTLFNNRKLAYVGKTPGKTRMLNFFGTGELVFVDAPGYGYANRSQREAIVYQKMMDEYLEKRENLALIIWILDIRRVPNQDDLLMLAWLLASKHPFLLVLNKCDKLSNNQRIKQLALIQKELSLSAEQFLLYSAKTSLGNQLLLEKLTEFAYNKG